MKFHWPYAEMYPYQSQPLWMMLLDPNCVRAHTKGRHESMSYQWAESDPTLCLTYERKGIR